MYIRKIYIIYLCVCKLVIKYDDVMKVSTINTCPCHLAKLSCSLCCGDVAREAGYPHRFE